MFAQLRNRFGLAAIACALLVALSPRSPAQDLWPGGVIPYQIRNDVPAITVNDIQWAVNHWNTNTVIRLVPRTNQNDWVVFVPGEVCQSPLGRQGGQQQITLATDCGRPGAVHEIGHAAGLIHEQNRRDRDRFVERLDANIVPDELDQFEIDPAFPLLGNYDFDSIMHYGPFDFTRNGEPTLLRRRAWSMVIAGTGGGLSSPWVLRNTSDENIARLAYGDFDADGRSDVFLATGTTWQVSFAASSNWQVINTSATRQADLALHDFNGDGRTDVFYASGSAWYVSWGGTSSWRQINTSAYRVSSLGFGDFDGDRRTDVFLASGGRWYVSRDAVGSWQAVNTSTAPAGDLALADFNGDGRTDVFYADGSTWRVSDGATASWTTFNSSTLRKSALLFGDFDGDGRTDVLGRIHRTVNGRVYREWNVSWEGRSSWDPVRLGHQPGVDRLAAADFTGDGRDDIVCYGMFNEAFRLSAGDIAKIAALYD